MKSVVETYSVGREVLRLVLGGNFILLTTGSSELAFLQGLERGVPLMTGPSSSSSP